MDFGESFRLAISALAANRLRAILTTLGIIIGVGAVVSLISLGRGVEDYITREFKELGSNLVFVFSSDPESPTRDRIEPLTTNEAAALLEAAPSIVDVAVSYGVNGTVVYRNERIDGELVGQTINFFEIRDWLPLEGGRVFTPDEVDRNARVILLGPTVNEELFGDKEFNSVGEIVRVNDISFEVIGVMPELSTDITGENNLSYIPITTAQRRLDNARARDGSYEVDVYQLQVVNEDLMDQAVLEIEAFMNEAHNIRFDGEEDYTVVSQSDVLGTLEAVTGVLTIFLGMIASISLLVGGIGIMNIMLVSVTERTREIGLRKAVGARGRDILIQFLIESVVLSIVGGIIGVLVAWTVTILGTQFVPGLRLSLTVASVALATIVSSVVGVVFGVFPANRAAKMRPIDALSYE